MEDINVNRLHGFAEECAIRFNENVSDPKSVYQRINKVFEYLPVACLIDDKIFCVHSGIGQNLKNINEIERLSRRVEIV